MSDELNRESAVAESRGLARVGILVISDRASRGIRKADRTAGVGPNGDASKYFSVCRGSKPDGPACCAFAGTGDAIISASTVKANLTVTGRRPAPDPITAHP